MKRPGAIAPRVFPFLACLVAAPLLAQTQIGGGTCSSASLSGAYAVTITGRQLAVSGGFTNVFQATGSATFDGLSKVTISLVENTVQTTNTPLNWSGTYSVQSNCAGQITINSGGNPAFNLVAYSDGADFLITGNDATYSYSGSGNDVPQTASCSTSTLQGVYTVNATGFALSSSGIDGAANLVGLLQFDGQGNLTINMTVAQNGAANASSTLSGPYSVASNCLGSATLTDSKSNTYHVNLSVYNVSLNSAAFYVSIARSANFMTIGGAHIVYGQPSASTAMRELEASAADRRRRA